MIFVKIRNLYSDKILTVGGGGWWVLPGGNSMPRGETVRQARLELWTDQSRRTQHGNFNQHWYQVKDPIHGWYKFIARRSPLAYDGHGAIKGHVIDAEWGLNPNALLQQYWDNNGNNQHWISSGESPSDSNYFFIADLGNQFAWELPIPDPEERDQSFFDDGVFVRLGPLTGDDNQAWRIEPFQVDAFILKAVSNGLVVDVPDFSQATVNLQQYPRNGGFNQLWEFLPTTNAPFGMLRSVCSGKVFNVFLPNVGTPSLLDQQEPNGGINQEYRSEVIDHSPTGNEIVKIVPRAKDNFAVGVINSDVHGSIAQYPNDGDIYQQWEKIPIGTLGD